MVLDHERLDVYPPRAGFSLVGKSLHGTPRATPPEHRLDEVPVNPCPDDQPFAPRPVLPRVSTTAFRPVESNHLAAPWRIPSCSWKTFRRRFFSGTCTGTGTC